MKADCIMLTERFRREVELGPCLHRLPEGVSIQVCFDQNSKFRIEFKDIPADKRDQIISKLDSTRDLSFEAVLYCPAVATDGRLDLKCPLPDICFRSAVELPTTTSYATDDELRAACYPGFPCTPTAPARGGPKTGVVVPK